MLACEVAFYGWQFFHVCLMTRLDRSSSLSVSAAVKVVRKAYHPIKYCANNSVAGIVTKDSAVWIVTIPAIAGASPPMARARV